MEEKFGDFNVDDFRTFPESKAAKQFIVFLLKLSNVAGATGRHAKSLHTFLERHRNECKRRSTPKYKRIKERTSKASDGTSCTIVAPTQIEAVATKHNLSYGLPALSRNALAERSWRDVPSHKGDESPLKRSASVELFPNFDGYEEHSTRAGNLQNINDEYGKDPIKSALITKAPVVSVKQNVNQLKNREFSYDWDNNSISFNKLLLKQNQMKSFIRRRQGDQLDSDEIDNSEGLHIPQNDDCSWISPPSKTPCILQYKLAKQFNRNIVLPALVSDLPDEEYSSAKADIKRFFASIELQKGTRYTAQSDYLNLYPQCVLELLQGPFGQTAYDNALRFRCLSSGNLHNFSSKHEANDYILPPPEVMLPLCLWMGTYGIPRDDKRYRGGEDAWFTSSALNAMAVADGVSEWMELVGINPREFAEDLVSGTKNELYKLKEKGLFDCAAPSITPAKLADEALGKSFKNAKHFGSSTAIVALLNPMSSILGIANLGDSGALILRRSTDCGQLCVVGRTCEMQHGFNVPYQFTHLPGPEQWDELKHKGMNRLVKVAEHEYRKAQTLGKRIGDLPEDIQSFDVPVREGDLIILGTDGLFDNLFDYEITSLTALAVSPREAKLLYHDVDLATSPKDISRSLALLAYWKSVDAQAKTPFAKYSKLSSQHRSLFEFIGGKEDDISVAVAWVTLKQDTVCD